MRPRIIDGFQSAICNLKSAILAILCLLLLVQASTRGQDEKPDPDALTKKKTLELLEKAKDEYRIYFKRPEKTFEYWSAIKFEMDLGKFDLAALHLKYLLAKEPPEDVDKDLVKIEQAEGTSAFLRLKLVRQWSSHPPFQKEANDNVDKLIDRLTKAVEKHLSNPDRIKKFMKQLVAPTEEERAFAYVQLARSRERAVPYLIEGLRANYGNELHNRLRHTMITIGSESVPWYLETFRAANEKDFRDHELRLTLLDIIQQRDDKRVVPYLWHMSSAKQYPIAVRQKAKEVLASLLRIDVNDVPPAKESLTFLAERFYQHKVLFKEGEPVRIWPWNGESVSLAPVELTPYQAEEFFGMRYARQALDLDPGYQPAQIVLLSLMLERYYKPEVDQILMKATPAKMHHLLTTIDADLVMRVMDRAMEDRQIPIILPLMQALGDRGEYRAIRVNTGGQPGGVTRGLYYPDRRVQFAAKRAMLRMPAGEMPATAADRIVDLSRRFLAAGVAPKALVAFPPAGQDEAVGKTITALGFEPVVGHKVKELFSKGKRAADIDLVILHQGVSEQEFPFVYSQLRKDVDLAGLAMVVVVDKKREKAVRKFTARDPSVMVLVNDKLIPNDETKELLEKHIKNVQFAKLTAEERKSFAAVSMDTLWRMGRGEISGYNVAPAMEVILDQLRNPENELMALEIIARQPGADIQYRLAGLVNDPMRGKLRLPAAYELNRHILRNGLLLDKKQLNELLASFQGAADDANLRKELTVTVSMIARSNARQTGGQLIQFRPDPPAPPMEKEKEKEKGKDMNEAK